MKGFVASFVFTACFSIAQAATLKIVDTNGQLQAGITVHVAGETLTTNDKGEVTTPNSWTQSLPVTIEGGNLVRTTHNEVKPDVGQLAASQKDGEEKIEISGTLTDYGNIRTDGKIDAGAFIPALPRSELIYFDVSSLISPEFDKISVLGREIAFPSNLTLPRQQESYIFPITLDKPNFRMYVRKPGKYRFLALHGQFPLKRVVDDFRGGAPAYDIVNHGTIVQSGIVDLNISGSVSNLSIPVNSTPFSSEIALQAPQLAKDDVVLSVALNETDGGTLLPSDVKRLRSGQQLALKAPASKGIPMVLSLWFKERQSRALTHHISLTEPNEALKLPFDLLYEAFRDQFETQAANVNYKQVSFALQTALGRAPEFIGHVNPPQISGTRLNLTPPNAPSNVKPLATLLIYSAIKRTGTDQIEMEQRSRLWEVMTPGWVSSVELPNLPAPKLQADKFRWEVLYLGQDGQTISHVSRNAVDL